MLQESLAELLSKKLVLVTGKGGIGKSLVSTALALEARKLGKKVCLVESTAHDQIAPLFGVAPIGHQLRELLLCVDSFWRGASCIPDAAEPS